MAIRVFSTFFVVVIMASLTATAEEKRSLKIWRDNKLTQDQPFPARVIAVKPSWVGYHLLLEEISGERLCVAQVWETTGLVYHSLDKSKELVRK